MTIRCVIFAYGEPVEERIFSATDDVEALEWCEAEVAACQHGAYEIWFHGVKVDSGALSRVTKQDDRQGELF